jgi:transposase-like protein
MGATITEAAQAAGVTRQTVSEWCNHHGAFQAELSERRASALRDAQQQLEAAALIAVGVLSELAQDPAVPATVGCINAMRRTDASQFVATIGKG